MLAIAIVAVAMAENARARETSAQPHLAMSWVGLAALRRGSKRGASDDGSQAFTCRNQPAGGEPGSDWSVRCGVRFITCTYLIDAGLQARLWTWSGLWLPSEVGNAARLAVRHHRRPIKVAT